MVASQPLTQLVPNIMPFPMFLNLFPHGLYPVLGNDIARKRGGKKVDPTIQTTSFPIANYKTTDGVYY